jgi:hypothetical protein
MVIINANIYLRHSLVGFTKDFNRAQRDPAENLQKIDSKNE